MPGRTLFRRRLALLGLLCAAGAVACADRQPTGVLAVELSMAKGGGGGGGGGGGPTPIVNTTDPSSAPQDVRLDVRVLGANFDDGSTVRFLLNGKGTAAVVVNGTRFVGAGELVADLTITIDAIPDLYDVEVTTLGGKKGIGIEKFAVTGPTADIAVAGVSAGPGVYGDGGGLYQGEFINPSTSGGGAGNFNMRPECTAGRRIDARLPWSITGTVSDCSGSGRHAQFHLPGIYFADCSDVDCPIGGLPASGSGFSPSVNYYFTVDSNGDGRFGPPRDIAYNVVWTDARFSVLRRASGGTPCEWRVTASTASLYSQSLTPLFTGAAVSLDVTVARDDGACGSS